jgi:hypothetical protein
MILLKINLGKSGKVQRRHPYILIKHSISNRNFEIHIFALLTFRRNSGMLQQATQPRTKAMPKLHSHRTEETRSTTISCLPSCPHAYVRQHHLPTTMAKSGQPQGAPPHKASRDVTLRGRALHLAGRQSRCRRRPCAGCAGTPLAPVQVAVFVQRRRQASDHGVHRHHC